MTSSPDVVPSHTSTSLPTIYTANGSPMHVSHLGNVSTPALSVSNVYQIPKLTHNLPSVGQLTELGFSLTFFSTGVVVQDSQMGQIVGTTRKVGRLFELIMMSSMNVLNILRLIVTSFVIICFRVHSYFSLFPLRIS